MITSKQHTQTVLITDNTHIATTVVNITKYGHVPEITNFVLFAVLDTWQSHQDAKDKGKVSSEAEEAGLEDNALVQVIAVAKNTHVHFVDVSEISDLFNSCSVEDVFLHNIRRFLHLQSHRLEREPFC